MMRLVIATCACMLAICAVSCAHNAGGVVIGKRFAIGADPNTAQASASYEDGFSLFDAARENSAWTVEVDDVAGIKVEDGNVSGIKKIKREIGPQVTGYLVDLAKVDSGAAQEYVRSMRAYWEYKRAEVEANNTPDTPIK